MNHRARVDLFRALLSRPKEEHIIKDSTERGSLDYSKQCRVEYNEKELRELCSGGISDEPGIRPTCWKILLGYLPREKKRWEEHLSSQRQAYYDFVQEMIIEPGLKVPQSGIKQDSTQQAKSDHPLCSEPSSNWNGHFQDMAILEQIDIDIRRTLADVAFFQREMPLSPTSTPIFPSSPEIQPYRERIPVQISLSAGGGRTSPSRRGLLHRFGNRTHVSNGKNNSGLNIKTERSLSLTHTLETSPKPTHLSANLASGEGRRYSEAGISGLDSIKELAHGLSFEDGRNGVILEESTELHWEAMERILFIYVKLNPGIGYVQGMNELVGPLYYVCANDSDDHWLAGKIHAEADTFYLFTILMSLVRDQYIRECDEDRQSGVTAMLQQLELRLQHASLSLAQDMQQKSINHTFYAFRWITVLGTHEFALPDVIALWDGLFSYFVESPPDPASAMIMVSVAMLVRIKDQLLDSNFSENLRLLQHYPPVDMAELLASAHEIDIAFQSGKPIGTNPQPFQKNTNIQQHLAQFKSLIEAHKEKPLLAKQGITSALSNFSSTPLTEINIPPVYKESLSKSWTAAKRFLSNTHQEISKKD